MYSFAQRDSQRSDFVVVATQRKPKSYLGLERMLLHWVSLMSFVTLTSLSLVSVPGVASRVLQLVWLPFALAGIVYALLRYYRRLRSLVFLGGTVDSRIGSEPAVYVGLVLLLCAVVLSVLVLTVVSNRLL
jgi:hypothetical protein